ncbi:MAG: hypothetical protein L0Z55_10485 [Planctomycetes bacterium]|nr:hypothetical protein [Planctomycetota bacterium]
MIAHFRCRCATAWLCLAAAAAVLTTGARTAASDLWPLVKTADGAVWGTLIDAETGVQDRLLSVQVGVPADGRDPRGPVLLRLVERGGMLPDGSWLAPGATGLFLYHAGTSPRGEFSAADGTFVSGGFSAMAARADAIAAIAEVFCARAAGREPERAPFLALLDSPDPACRSFALGRLRHESVTAELAAGEAAAIRRACEAETDESNRRELLELCLLRRLGDAGDMAAELLLGARSGDAIETALIYLAEHAKPHTKAELLIAYPAADASQKVLLLEAYARLELAEAQAWWEDALFSENPTLRSAALLGIGKARVPCARELYEEILRSDDDEVRCLALQGIAALDGGAARQLLGDYVASAPRGDRGRELAQKILRHPYRYGRSNSEREARRAEERK